MSKGRKLTNRERLFVEAFMGPAKGVARQAALLAGCPKAGAGQQGYRMLKNVHVGAAIAAKVAKRAEVAEFTAAERDAMLARIARANEAADPRVSKEAIAELNKCEGRHSTNVKVSGKVLLEDALAAAERKLSA